MKKKLSKLISKSAIILWVCLLATISCQKSEWESDVIKATFGFSTNSATQKYTFVEPGKFYKLHPVLNDGMNQTIEIIYVDFVEGTVKE